MAMAMALTRNVLCAVVSCKLVNQQKWVEPASNWLDDLLFIYRIFLKTKTFLITARSKIHGIPAILDVRVSPSWPGLRIQFLSIGFESIHIFYIEKINIRILIHNFFRAKQWRVRNIPKRAFRSRELAIPLDKSCSKFRIFREIWSFFSITRFPKKS